MNTNIVRKRLSMRSWRRGTKELDLILGKFSDKYLTKLEIPKLELYEQFLSNDDHLIYSWLFEKAESPKIFKSLIKKIQDSIRC